MLILESKPISVRRHAYLSKRLTSSSTQRPSTFATSRQTSTRPSFHAIATTPIPELDETCSFPLPLPFEAPVPGMTTISLVTPSTLGPVSADSLSSSGAGLKRNGP